MKVELECIPCIIRQTVDNVRGLLGDLNQQRAVINEVLHYLSEASLDVTPPELGKNVYQIIKNITRNNDPFKEIKQKDNQAVLNIYEYLKTIIYKNPDPLKTAAKLAIAGNIIDYGANNYPIDMNQIGETINDVELSVNHLQNFLDDLNRVHHVLYLADNAGELVLDKLFIEMLRRFYMVNKFEITVVVRGEPIINDATLEDADYIGMNEVASLIDNGDDAPGTLLKYCSPEMQRYYHQADLIISKGQGNYETLDSEDKLIYFLLKAKCPIIATNIGVQVRPSIDEEQKDFWHEYEKEIMNILIDVKQYTTLLLKDHLPKTLTFHDYLHTQEVKHAVLQIGRNSGLSNEELEIVTIAAWFHDTGHTISYTGHEEHSKKIAQDFLSEHRYKKNKIQKVNECIESTILPQTPLDKIEGVLCDADLFHLSQQNYFVKNELLRREWELVGNKYYSDIEWYDLNIRFLKNHHYFSAYGMNILEKQKRLNINRLLKLFNSSKKGRKGQYSGNLNDFQIMETSNKSSNNG